MRAKEFTRETIAPIAPVAPVATRPIDKAIAQAGQPAGPAGIDQAIAQTTQPKGPGLASKIASGLKTAGSRFAYGLSQGASSALSSTPDALSKAGTSAGFAADVATQEKAEAPAKQAFSVFAGQIRPEQVDPQLKTQVDQILKSQLPQQQGWIDHVRKNTTPWDATPHPEAGTAANAAKRVNPNDIVAYLKQNSRGQKLTATGNLEVDKLLKAQGLL